MNELSVGAVVGPYTIESCLGAGGMGSIYVAHARDDREVILKFPHITMLGDPALFDRYQRELEIGRLLDHPGVQRVIDTGDYEGNPYMVTLFAPGVSLRAYLGSHSPLPVPEAVRLLGGLCDGVAYCHEHGVFHRDLKPENIIISPQGDPTIIDFGIALLRGARRITWSGLSSAVGTPDYMAPEQIQGKRGDARTDIYALGAMGYEFVSGQVPFSGDNPLAVMSQHLYGVVRPITEIAPAVPPALDVVIRKAMQRNPDDRYQTADDFRMALLHFDTTKTVLHDDTPPTVSPRFRQVLVYTLVIGAIIAGIILLGILAQIAHGGH